MTDLLESIKLLGNQFVPFIAIIAAIYCVTKFINFASATDIEKTLEENENTILRRVLRELALFIVPLLLSIIIFDVCSKLNYIIKFVIVISFSIIYIVLKSINFLNSFNITVIKSLKENYIICKSAACFLGIILYVLILSLLVDHIVSGITNDTENWGKAILDSIKYYHFEIVILTTAYIVVYIVFRLLINDDYKCYHDSLKKVYKVTIITKNQDEIFEDYFLLRSSQKYFLISKKMIQSPDSEIIYIDKLEVNYIKIKRYQKPKVK